MTLIDDDPYAKVKKTPNPRNAGTPPAFFSAWDLHAYYGESYIVQGVSFNIHEGEILALLGRNGAGKTSTLRTIARAGNPELKHGEIWLDHKPVHEMKAHQAAQNGIQLVPEDRRIIPGLTVEENLRLALRIGRGDWAILFANKTSLVLVALTVAVVFGPSLKRRFLDSRKNGRE